MCIRDRLLSLIHEILDSNVIDNPSSKGYELSKYRYDDSSIIIFPTPLIESPFN